MKYILTIVISSFLMAGYSQESEAPCKNMARDLSYVECLVKYCETIDDFIKAKECRLEARSIRSNIISNQNTLPVTATMSAEDFLLPFKKTK